MTAYLEWATNKDANDKKQKKFGEWELDVFNKN